MTSPYDGMAMASVEEGDLERRVLEGKAPDGFLVRILLDGANLPVRVSYEADKGKTIVTEFSDRRRVEGVLLPYRLITSSGKQVVDDLVLTEIVVNPTLTEADFAR
jgi:hypothetical protein